MEIRKLTFQNFRNLENSYIEPNNEINLIYGNNAQGKTNLLESLWLFTGGHSFRGNKDNQLPKIIDQKNSKIASLKANFYANQREQWAILNIENGKRNSIINGVEKKTGSALVGKICAVIFSPEHLMLIKEGPSFRRTFIDAAICQIEPSYPKLLSKYNRVIMQRNALLRQIQTDNSLEYMLDIWNERAVTFGCEIINKRIKYAQNLNNKAKEIYFGISGQKENFNIEYKPLSLNASEYLENPKEKYINALKRTNKSDLRLGITSIGPHRDDCEIFINNLEARTYGSQGQQRSAVIALKLAEAEILEENIGETPIILLDDVMSELDNERQSFILNKLTGKQIFITCCSPETINLMDKGKMFHVKNGEIN